MTYFTDASTGTKRKTRYSTSWAKVRHNVEALPSHGPDNFYCLPKKNWHKLWGEQLKLRHKTPHFQFFFRFPFRQQFGKQNSPCSNFEFMIRQQSGLTNPTTPNAKSSDPKVCATAVSLLPPP
jgi:hypothetical protein